jgi:hypothetical protein
MGGGGREIEGLLLKLAGAVYTSVTRKLSELTHGREKSGIRERLVCYFN